MIARKRETKQSNSLSSSATISLSQQSIYESSTRFSNQSVDALGFYRFMSSEDPFWSECPAAICSTHSLTSSPDNLELCQRLVRHQLGINNFDRLAGYEKWKNGWDNFMRTKLIESKPVIITKEFKTRLRSGIPHDYRPKVWTALILMRTQSIREKYGYNLYERILQECNLNLDYPETTAESINASSIYNIIDTTTATVTSSSDSAPPFSRQVTDKLLSECLKQIDLDLLRTLPNNRHFQAVESIGIQRVRRVLAAYAYFNPSVGYCQGMNRLAAVALLVIPETEAFLAMIAIINCIMPDNYYLKPWLAQVDCFVLTDLLAKCMPNLHKHLVKNDIQLTIFSWFFTVFVDGFRPELMFRIWDAYLLEGHEVLFKYALAILFVVEKDLLKIDDLATLSSLLRKTVASPWLNTERLADTITVAFSTMNFVSHRTICDRRGFHIKRMESIIVE